jgi:hypothetical protein
MLGFERTSNPPADGALPLAFDLPADEPLTPDNVRPLDALPDE